MFVPLNKSCVMVGGAVPPLRKNPQDDIALSSTEGKGANQIVGASWKKAVKACRRTQTYFSMEI